MRKLQIIGIMTMIVTSLFSLTLFVQKVSAQTPCAGADALRKVKLYDDAKTVYVDLLNGDPKLICAINGIKAIAVIENIDPALTCASADTLREAKLYEDAQKTYVALLDENPQLDCAINGIKAIAVIENIDPALTCGSADTLREAKLYEDAQKTYVALLDENPQLDCAINGIGAIVAVENDQAYETVRKLSDLGLYTEAAEQLQEIIKEKPTVIIPDDLKYLTGGHNSRWLSIRKRVVVSRPTLEIASDAISYTTLVLVLIFIGIPLLIYRIIPALMRPYKTLFDISDFDAGATDLPIGKGIAAMVEKYILELSTQTNIPLPNLVTGPLEPLAFPSELRGLASTSINIAAQLLEWAVPPRVITLSGYLQKAGQEGAGITLVLVDERSKRILANETLWQRSYNPGLTLTTDTKDPSPYYGLARHVAIWALYSINRHIEN